MKKLLSIFACFVMIVGLSACGGICTECECAGDITTLCAEDFDTQKQYNAAVQTMEAFNCVCTPVAAPD